MAVSNVRFFLQDESGAVTVDWVVLTAAIVGLGLAVMAVVSGGVENLSTQIDSGLRQDIVNQTFDDAGEGFTYGGASSGGSGGSGGGTGGSG
jgi:Flp pilus assembly pilin Flp